MNPPKPPKPRRLHAPIEPDLPEAGVGDDPRGALHKALRRGFDPSVQRLRAPAEGALVDGAGGTLTSKGVRSPPHPFHPASPSMPARAGLEGRAADAGTLPTDIPREARYAELHCLSNFSFQRGASSAPELFERARKLGYGALAITDECSLSGIVRALEASGDTGVALVVGTEVQLADGPKLVLLARNQDGYTDICKLITTGRRRSAKGEYRLTRADAELLGDGVLVLVVTATHVDWIARHFRGRTWLAVELHCGPDDAVRLADLRALGARHGLPLVATGDVHMHVRRRRALQDVMTAIRLGRTVAEAGHALFPNGERHLRCIDELAALYPEDLLSETLRIASMCTFNLRKLDYRYPKELVPPGMTAIEHLRMRTWSGAALHWPAGMQAAVKAQIEKELALIEYLKYEHFFLTVEDIVRWAREQKPPILCQGRGSSANSAVCYCLGITVVTPEDGNLLFERFLSEERDEPPDIDVDFEHERREEVIQYVFGKYGRDRAAIAATVISYRGKSAVRDVGRALGVPEDQLDNLTGMFSRVRSDRPLEAWLRERGFDPASRVLHRLFKLANEIRGFPRHLSQHVGGFVISEQPLHHLVPVENASMPDRTIIQWDKDDLETMKLLKVDCLALGMLTCIRKCLDLLHDHGLWDQPYIGSGPSLVDIPKTNDEAVYNMICQADTIGVFQIESRAQMSMLPRLRPRTFYDLVVEVAIVRPGPIQGDMVHPYLRRRKGLETVDYPQSRFERESGTEESGVEGVLKRTLGVPIFQEQVMKLIQVVAGFSAGEADGLRRAMAAWKRRGGLEHFHDKIRGGMLERGYDEAYFERIFKQIQGFGEYGFPESHAASFAQLAWASSWLKHYHPAAFAAALLNAQPMGFYQPSQLIQDAQRHGVHVLPVDVVASDWDCTLEPLPAPNQCPPPGQSTAGADPVALRLGMREIRGLSQELALRIAAARSEAPFRDVVDMTRRASLNATERARLADAGALQSLSGHRYRARWESAGAEVPAPILAGATIREASVELRRPSLREDVMTDYATLGLSLTQHPLSLVRDELARRRVSPARMTADAANRGKPMRCAGLVTVRQHPGTAKGVTFVTLEDETGIVNVVVWRALAQKQHRVLLESTVMAVDGVLEASDGVYHLIAKRLHDFSALLPEFSFSSRDFH
jgi:error-prone DNA polymerase